MKDLDVFVSWSGSRSRNIATALTEWLEGVLQKTKPWMSTEIEAGARWSGTIAQSLSKCDFGVVCLTPENMNSVWLHFEAGALSKTDLSKVVPYLFDLTPTDLEEPFSAFQAVRADQEGTRELITSLNKTCDEPLHEARLNSVFDAMWPHLKPALDNVPPPDGAPPPPRTIDDRIDEILTIGWNGVRGYFEVGCPI